MAHGDLRGITRARVRENYCPKCGAEPGQPCRGIAPDHRPRVANHVERRQGAKLLRAKKAASRGRGYDLWSRVAHHNGHMEPSLVHELRQRADVVALESEIERAFAVHLLLQSYLGPTQFVLRAPKVDEKCYFLLPQYEIGPYRADFVFGLSSRLELRQTVAVELDGHEWHEKTKAQAARDKARDRYLQQHFGKVIHFTGAEVYEDVSECATELLRVFVALHGKVVDF